jgi:prepilin-type N-terminal cleavage/methylation domain-containing protein
MTNRGTTGIGWVGPALRAASLRRAARNAGRRAAQDALRPAARHGRRKGWSLLECLLVLAIIGIILIVGSPLIRGGTTAFNTAEDRVQMTQEARFALAHVASALRQARVVTAAADDNAGAASLSFLAFDGTPTAFGRQAGTTNLVFGPVAAPALISKKCSALGIRCYDAAGTLIALPIAQPTNVATVEVAMTVSDPRGVWGPAVVTTRAGLLRTQPSVIVNEIMYNASAPLGGGGQAGRWLELFNTASTPVDVGGWSVWSKDQVVPYVIQPDTVYSTGSTVIPPGGHAVLTGRNSKLYQDFLNNGDFETTDMSGWRFTTTRWVRNSGNAFSGSYKVQITGGLWTTMYQDFKISSGLKNARLFVRAKMQQGTPVQSRCILRTTDRGAVVLVPVFDGALTSEWTTYTADLTSIINRDARLEIKVYSPGVTDTMLVDGTGVVATVLPAHSPDCLHFWTGSNDVADDLSKLQVFLAQGNVLRDAVVWSKTWGGDGDGTTLRRINPWAPSTLASSWGPGPYGGTPGAPN